METSLTLCEQNRQNRQGNILALYEQFIANRANNEKETCVCVFVLDGRWAVFADSMACPRHDIVFVMSSTSFSFPFDFVMFSTFVEAFAFVYLFITQRSFSGSIALYGQHVRGYAIKAFSKYTFWSL